MSQGHIRRRCRTCGTTVPSGPGRGTCPKCGGANLAWAFEVNAGGRRKGAGGFATKAAAAAAMAELQVGLATGTHVERHQRTLGEYLETWLTSRTAVKPNTRAEYGVSIHRHIAPRLGTRPLQAITRLDVKALYAQLATEAGLAEKTVHNIHICLRKALQDALEDGLLRSNPADQAHTKPKTRPEMVTWTLGELQAFLATVAGDPELPLWRLAAMTGMRRGELLGLRRHDVDLDHGRVNVRQQWGRNGVDGLGFGTPKSRRSIRSIDLDPETLEVLREHLEGQAFARRRKDYQDQDLVFAHPDGRPFDPNVIGRRLSRRIDAAGLPHFGPHGLRHTHATLLLEAGEPAHYVSERLGHDSVQTTLQLYGHVTPRMRQGAAARFGVLVAGQPRVAEGTSGG